MKVDVMKEKVTAEKKENGLAAGISEKYQRGKHDVRRNHILDAAFVIFIENGYSNTKMADIAEAAGYGKSTLYEYFESKEEILAELFRVKLIDRYQIVAESVDQSLSSWEKLVAYLDGVIDIILEYGADERIVAMFMTHPEYMATPALFEAAQKIMRLNFENVSRYIIEGTKDGSFSAKDPYTAASLVIGATSSYLGMITAPEYKEFAEISAGGGTDDDRRQAFYDLIYRALCSEESGK
jgi:TetR/AcrR family fatty acid metabolism transcriptional regulator